MTSHLEKPALDTWLKWNYGGYRYRFALKTVHGDKNMLLKTPGSLIEPQAQIISGAAASLPPGASVRTLETRLKSQKGCEMTAQQITQTLHIWRALHVLIVEAQQRRRSATTLGTDQASGRLPSRANLSSPSKHRRATGTSDEDLDIH